MLPCVAEENEVLNCCKSGVGVLSCDQVIINDDVIAIRFPIYNNGWIIFTQVQSFFLLMWPHEVEPWFHSKIVQEVG